MAADLTTADVYEEASLIGQDIEKIIERFGHDAVMDLMPKIIRVLERLELVVGEKEKDKLEIAELKLENERLYLEIKREASQRRKLDEELYQISATGETDNLKATLIKLQEENRKLRLEYEVSANNQPATAYISAPGDAELMYKMKETIDNQRDTIRSKNMEIDGLRNDLEAMEEQIERLTNINESVRKTLGTSQARISVLAKEKAELQTELRSIQRTTSVSQVQTAQDESVDDEYFPDSDNELNEQYSADDEEDVEDAEKTQNAGQKPEEPADLSLKTPPPKPPRLNIELDVEENGHKSNHNDSGVKEKEKNGKDDLEEDELIEKKMRKEDELEHGDWEFVGEMPEKTYKREKSKEEQKERREENHTKTKKENKDPNRPRYTKAEMLEVLVERNDLKERVFALEDELKIYKPSYAAVAEQIHSSKHTTSSRKASRKEESGISKIFSIFSHHRN